MNEIYPEPGSNLAQKKRHPQIDIVSV